MQGASCSKRLVLVYQITWHHVPEDWNFQYNVFLRWSVILLFSCIIEDLLLDKYEEI